MNPRNIKLYGLNIKQILLIGYALCVSSVSNAALFDCSSEPGYCIGEGDTVLFKIAGLSSSLGLFGTPEVFGDTIVTLPTDFRAESLNNGGAVSVNDNRTIQVIAKPGFQIDGVKILERGDHYMKGTGTSVDVDGLFNVFDPNNLFGGPSLTQSLIISGDLTIIDESLHTWTGSTDFDLTGPAWGGINHISIGLQNNLNATASALGEIAWIEKKVVGIGLVSSPVPVPAAAWLFASGLLAIAGLARARRKA